jgi:hypothetical protein
MSGVLALVRAWLILDFFGDSRRAGRGHTSSLTTAICTQSFVALAFAALLYPETPPVAFAAANLCLSTLLVALGALGDESRPWRQAADRNLIATSPMPASAVVLARSSHAAFAVVLVTVGMALPPAILLAFQRQQAWLAAGYVAGACACSSLACGLFGTAGRIVARCTDGARVALAMGTARALLLGGGLVAFAQCLPRLRETVEELPFGAVGAALLPPWHVARWLAAPQAEAWRLLLLLAAGAALLGIAIAVGDLPGERPRRHSTRGPLWWLLRRATSPGPHRGIAEFVAIGMWRQAGFRARVLPLLGVPAAAALLAAHGGSGAGGPGSAGFGLVCVLMQLPAIYVPFLVAFLPRADQPDTNWVFGHAPALPAGLVHDAVWRALTTHVLAPVLSLATLLVLVLGDTGTSALPAAAFALGLAILTARSASRRLDVLPFAVDVDADVGPGVGDLFAPALLLAGLGLAFGLWLPAAWHWPVAAGTFLIALLAWRRPAPTTGPPLPDGQRDPEVDAGLQTQAAKADPKAVAERGLGGELRAIGVLLLVLAVLPCLLGSWLAA